MIYIFDWIGDLISGIGEAISGAFSALWTEVSSSIFGIFMEWLYRTVYGALADFFTMMSGMGVKLFDLPWIQAALRFFQLFGWGLFVVGIAVAVFDFASEYQSYGRANIKNTLLNILKGFFAVSLFTVVPVELYRFTVTLQNIFSRDLAGVFGRTEGLETAAKEILSIAKKVLSFLLSNKKGRKFLGYVIGIALFVVLLPLIVMIGLFGWMSGGDNMVIQNTVAQQLQSQYAEQFPEHETALEKITVTFGTLGISGQAGLAQTIYISSDLPLQNTDDTFYATYADCFLNVSEEKSLTDNITEAFGIEFTDKDKADIAAWNG